MHVVRFLMTTGLVVGAFTSVGCARKADAPADTGAIALTPPSPTVSVIETGRHIGPNRRISDTTSTFAPGDTLYLSVVADNTPTTSMLTARWTFQDGQVVDSTSQAVAPSDMGGTVSVTEFHLVKPSGWPVGAYTVEVSLDGRVVGTRQVTVAR
jgi:hypothetical protein